MTPDTLTTTVATTPVPAWLLSRDRDVERLGNSGGPSSRKRTERLSSTLLGQEAGAIRCPRILRVGLDFGLENPLTWVRDALHACGFADEREARTAMALPAEPYMCRTDPDPSPTPVTSLAPDAALYQALVLGLCTPWLYDPARPVLWTRASLMRQLELFEAGGYYA